MHTKNIAHIFIGVGPLVTKGVRTEFIIDLTSNTRK